MSRQSSSFCLILPITRPQSLWNLKQAKKVQVNDKIRDPRQTNMSPDHYVWSCKQQGISFEKLLGWTVFKKPNFNPLKSSSVLPIRSICCFCYVIWTFLFKVLGGYFCVSLNLTGILWFPNLDEFRDTAPLIYSFRCGLVKVRVSIKKPSYNSFVQIIVFVWDLIILSWGTIEVDKTWSKHWQETYGDERSTTSSRDQNSPLH